MAARFVCILLTIAFSQAVHGIEVTVDPPTETELNPEAPLAIASSDTSARQQAGSNFASYNEPCANDINIGKLCIVSRGLFCDAGRCKCVENKEDSNIPLIYVNNTDVQRCVPLATSRNEYQCSWNQQCQQGKYGHWSRCHSLRCQCYDVEEKSRSVVENENACFLEKKIGDSCSDDLECNVTIPGEAICFGVRSNIGICQCASRYVWEGETAKACLQLRTINETCVHDVQCSNVDALDKLARCSNGRCECYDTKDESVKAKVGYYIPNPNTENVRGKCYYLKAANETCGTSEECKLGFHSNAICKEHSSYNGEFVCQCNQDGKCNSAGIGSASILMSIVAIIISLIFCNYVIAN